jgi:hypothetical protein
MLGEPFQFEPRRFLETKAMFGGYGGTKESKVCRVRCEIAFGARRGYTWPMITDIRKLLEARPFAPFAVVSSSGQHYRVSSPDHANVNPQGSRLLVWFDDDSEVIVSGLHIAAIEMERPQAA